MSKQIYYAIIFFATLSLIITIVDFFIPYFKIDAKFNGISLDLVQCYLRYADILVDQKLNSVSSTFYYTDPVKYCDESEYQGNTICFFIQFMIRLKVALIMNIAASVISLVAALLLSFTDSFKNRHKLAASVSCFCSLFTVVTIAFVIVFWLLAQANGNDSTKLIYYIISQSPYPSIDIGFEETDTLIICFIFTLICAIQFGLWTYNCLASLGVTESEIDEALNSKVDSA